MASHGKAHIRALYNIFVRPTLLTQGRPSQPIFPRPNLPIQHRLPARPFSLTAPRPRGGPTKPKKKSKTSTASGPLTNESIPARQVRVVDPTTNELGPVIPRRTALLEIDSTKNRLVCASKVPRYVSPGDPDYDDIAGNYDFIVKQYLAQQKRFGKKEEQGQEEQRDELSVLEEEEGEADEVDEEDLAAVRRAPAIYVPRGGYVRLPTGEDWVPVCKVENKAEAAAKARAKEVERKEARKLAPEGVKIIELNWAIGGNDLGHRLKKVEEFLKARRRVEIVIAPKRRGKKATKEEADGVLKKVREAVGMVEGAKETRPLQGQVGGVVSLMVEGKRGKDE
ncbi:hypothetical protein B9Z65_3193 [Elsinoe australis]|uniref:Translation initiation factor 3 N-terminal domain-containing protein n=1 Tax=Elsinoe australis TaxID=40998 RepID=A0A2P7ZUN2_9PEZI|nr:hypothetical protein B9Z65_3193 [Elsinoe australis]